MKKGHQFYEPILQRSNEKAATFQQLDENLPKHLQYIFSELTLYNYNSYSRFKISSREGMHFRTCFTFECKYKNTFYIQ